MALLHGIKEKIHMPLYDAFVVRDAGQTFAQAVGRDNQIRFFVDVLNKTRLETNLQTTGFLPSYNTFLAQALRVVFACGHRQRVTPADCKPIVDAALRLGRFKKKDDWDLSTFCALLERQLATLGSTCQHTLQDLIYASVLSLVVGEKVMIEMPTFYFPAGAGISPGTQLIANHGEPNPLATFRFAEPVSIDPRQSFRVELTFPQGIPARLAASRGPLRLWVILDGYLTRDVQ
jgi:hypothetical protein